MKTVVYFLVIVVGVYLYFNFWGSEPTASPRGGGSVIAAPAVGPAMLATAAANLQEALVNETPIPRRDPPVVAQPRPQPQPVPMAQEAQPVPVAQAVGDKIPGTSCTVGAGQTIVCPPLPSDGFVVQPTTEIVVPDFWQKVPGNDLNAIATAQTGENGVVIVYAGPITGCHVTDYACWERGGK
jgi:hypothetical protein